MKPIRPHPRLITGAVLLAGNALALPALALSAAAAPPDPINLAIELHVEGDPAADRSTIEQVAHDFAAAGIRVTFGLTPDFLDYLSRWSGSPSGLLAAADSNGDRSVSAAEFVAYLQDPNADRILDHAVTLHMEYNAAFPPLDDLTHQMQRLNTLGGDASTISGACTQDPAWLEDLRSAGDFDADGTLDVAATTVAGVVRACQTTLDPAIYGAYQSDAADACTGADAFARCHEPSPWDNSTLNDATEQAQRLQPWRATATATWMSDDGAGTLIVSSLPDLGLQCMAERSCTGTIAASSPADANADAQALFSQWLPLAQSRSTGAVGETLYLTWSLRTGTSPNYVRRLANQLAANYARANRTFGTVEWATLPEVAGEN